LAQIISRLRGAEVEVTTPTPFTSEIPFTGRIAGIEYRQFIASSIAAQQPWLLLNTAEGAMQFNLNEITSIRFLDPSIEADINRALDLISASRNSQSRQMTVSLPGSGARDVTISYVIPSPVWKVSYRLDLGASRPLFQGWAIVDNDSDGDWNNAQLSLVAGRPTSFIQNLYPPYYVSRPVLPLAIAGTAEAAVHDRAYGGESARNYLSEDSVMSEMSVMERRERSPAPQAAVSSGALAGGAIESASGSAAGGQFEFTIKNPVSLDRRMSAMYPLVESPIQARALLIYSGRGRHPRLGAEITNTTKMKLPAGPVTVYDGGVYAGDALLEFWNEDEKRLISFGEDLSVTVSDTSSNTRTVSSVLISGGIMTINRNITITKTYTFINSGSASKLLVLEHNKQAENLVSPTADEQTGNAYRFNVTLSASRETAFTVTERSPISERVALLTARPETFLSYTSNQEIPARAREALQRAVELKRATDAADQTVRDMEAQAQRLIADQDRIRRNLEAAGNQTQQGQEYLRRLVSLDSEIDALAPSLERARNSAKTAQQAWENYLNTLNL
ncbi:MAG: DUF4139 domain-containing protein, partial [Treponema sp.]|nr:DUF4139 domain-containing protein [Treponema sp.]